MVCGESTTRPPVMSMTPRIASEPGSCTGAAAQLQRCTGRTKCSADLIVTGASRHNAVPGALVPAWRSSHCAPSTNPIDSARRSTAGLPRTQSSRPRSSATASTLSQSSAASAGHVVQQREDLGQRVLGPVVGEQVRRQRDGWRAAVRVHARRRRPQPRVGDHPSHAHGDCPPLQQVLAGLADARDSGPAGQSGQLRGSDHDQPQKLGTACWLQSGISHCQPAGPDDVRYKVPETAAIGHAAPGPSAAVADDGLA